MKPALSPRRPRTLALLLLLLAAVLPTACSEEEKTVIPESMIIGRWVKTRDDAFTKDHLRIAPRDTVTYNGYTCFWTLDGDHFTAFGGTNTTYVKLDFRVMGFDTAGMALDGYMSETVGDTTLRYSVSGKWKREATNNNN